AQQPLDLAADLARARRIEIAGLEKPRGVALEPREQRQIAEARDQIVRRRIARIRRRADLDFGQLARREPLRRAALRERLRDRDDVLLDRENRGLAFEAVAEAFLDPPGAVLDEMFLAKLQRRELPAAIAHRLGA